MGFVSEKLQDKVEFKMSGKTFHRWVWKPELTSLIAAENGIFGMGALMTDEGRGRVTFWISDKVDFTKILKDKGMEDLLPLIHIERQTQLMKMYHE